MPTPVEVYDKVREELSDRFGDQVDVVYINVDDVIPEEAEAMADRIAAEDIWLPVVALEDQIVAEGVLRIRDLIQALKKQGIREIRV